MRKLLLCLAVAVGLGTTAHAAPAAHYDETLPQVGAAPVLRVDYEEWRRHEWRRRDEARRAAERAEWLEREEWRHRHHWRERDYSFDRY